MTWDLALILEVDGLGLLCYGSEDFRPAPLIVREILSIVRALRSDGVSILLVEQNARAALECSDRG